VYAYLLPAKFPREFHRVLSCCMLAPHPSSADEQCAACADHSVHVPVSQLMHRPDLGVGQRLLVIRGCRRSRSFSWAVNSVPCSRLPSLSEFSLISARYKMILNWPDWERYTYATVAAPAYCLLSKTFLSRLRGRRRLLITVVAFTSTGNPVTCCLCERSGQCPGLQIKPPELTCRQPGQATTPTTLSPVFANDQCFDGMLVS
jgi:hypothetical protein